MKQAGLTIVEVTVAIGLAVIVTVGLMPLFLHMFADGSRAAAEASMQEEGSAALSIIANHVARSAEIVAKPEVSDTQEPAGTGWVGSSNTLILSQIATSRALQDNARIPVRWNVWYGAGGCEFFDTTRPIYINYVFYVHNETLYQRTVGTNIPEDMFCDSPTVNQKTSCLTCSDKPKDIILARNVESFNLTYTPEDPGAENPYTNTDIVRMSLTLKTDNYRHTSKVSARMLSPGS